MKFVILSPDGLYVEQAGVSPVLPDGAIEVETHLSPSALTGFMFSDGAFIARPVIDGFDVVGGACTLSGLPSGAQVSVHDRIGAEVLLEVTADTDGQVVEFQLTDPGRYAVEVSPPLPWLPATFRFEVFA